MAMPSVFGRMHRKYGNQVKANAQLNLAAGKVFAVIFSVRLN
jgi:hypothetical protein